MWVVVTTVVFVGFVGMCLLMLMPTSQQLYKDADKLALKDDGEIITPRHSSDKRTES